MRTNVTLQKFIDHFIVQFNYLFGFGYQNSACYADTEAISYQSTLLCGSDSTTMLYKKIIFVKINYLHKSL